MVEASRIGTPVTQANHGFGRGDPVLFNGGNWVRATTGGFGVGVVGSVFDNHIFEFVQLGELDGLDDLVPGTTYYPASTGVGLSTTVNGSPVGLAYTATTLFVTSLSGGAAASDGFDHSFLVNFTALAASIAAEVARADLAYAAIGHDHDGRYIHSVTHDGVISVDIVAPGPIFDESDGTQVLVE